MKIIRLSGKHVNNVILYLGLEEPVASMATAAAVRGDGRGLASWPAGDTARQRKVTATRTHVQDEPETRPQGQHGLLPALLDRAHGQEGWWRGRATAHMVGMAMGLRCLGLG